MASFKIVSYNVRGLGDNTKRREIFHYLHTQPDDIILLQEAHCATHLEKRWKSEWGGGKSIFCKRYSTGEGGHDTYQKECKCDCPWNAKR